MTDAFRLDNQIAVVTGACGKLGPVWVDALVGAGARVAALDLPAAQASPQFAEVARRAGGAVRRIGCDITDRGSIEAAAQEVTAHLGAASVLAF